MTQHSLDALIPSYISLQTVAHASALMLRVAPQACLLLHGLHLSTVQAVLAAQLPRE